LKGIESFRNFEQFFAQENFVGLENSELDELKKKWRDSKLTFYSMSSEEPSAAQQAYDNGWWDLRDNEEEGIKINFLPGKALINYTSHGVTTEGVDTTKVDRNSLDDVHN